MFGMHQAGDTFDLERRLEAHLLIARKRALTRSAVPQQSRPGLGRGARR